MIVGNNHFAEQSLFLLVMDFFINNFLHIKLLPVVSYKRFKHKDGYIVSSSCSHVLPSFLCCLLVIYKTHLLISIDMDFYLMLFITIY